MTVVQDEIQSSSFSECSSKTPQVHSEEPRNCATNCSVSRVSSIETLERDHSATDITNNEAFPSIKRVVRGRGRPRKHQPSEVSNSISVAAGPVSKKRSVPDTTDYTNTEEGTDTKCLVVEHKTVARRARESLSTSNKRLRVSDKPAVSKKRAKKTIRPTEREGGITDDTHFLADGSGQPGDRRSVASTSFEKMNNTTEKVGPKIDRTKAPEREERLLSLESVSSSVFGEKRCSRRIAVRNCPEGLVVPKAFSDCKSILYAYLTSSALTSRA